MCRENLAPVTYIGGVRFSFRPAEKPSAVFVKRNSKKSEVRSRLGISETECQYAN
jgi:hypothetical protein